MPRLLALFLAACTALSGFAAYEVTDLRTELATDPLGIDVAAPRLGWKVVSAERG